MWGFSSVAQLMLSLVRYWATLFQGMSSNELEWHFCSKLTELAYITIYHKVQQEPEEKLVNQTSTPCGFYFKLFVLAIKLATPAFLKVTSVVISNKTFYWSAGP